MKNYFYTQFKRICQLEQLHDRWMLDYHLWATTKDESSYKLDMFLRNQRNESLRRILDEVYTRIDRRTPHERDYFYRTYIGYIDEHGNRHDLKGYIPLCYNPPEEQDIVILHTHISLVGTGDLFPVVCIFRKSGDDTIEYSPIEIMEVNHGSWYFPNYSIGRA